VPAHAAPAPPTRVNRAGAAVSLQGALVPGLPWRLRGTRAHVLARRPVRPGRLADHTGRDGYSVS